MPGPQRYTRFAVALHWIVAAIVFAQFALGWLMQEIAKQPAGPRASAFNAHKSIGMVILGLMLVRIAWRLSHRAPPLPAMPRWQARAALANHVLLYALLVVMPLAGYLGSAFSGYPVRFFGLVLPSWAPKSDALKHAMSEVHLVAAWLLAAAVLLHLAAVWKHAMVDRDGILLRMGWRGREDSAAVKAAGEATLS
ncbi:MAG TPA: cytochrome b [Usitatibacter sp.]|nr:cytochrome b [Usitatibacter sp.]